ncbi:protein of unknown function DUF3102 [Cyanobacterium sp. HL-69]|uniref:DUF3102 domain-containing protein n=1 Tax=Cyanobacterium sp. HL-69 TaxID=2054282 RepID=UPI000CA36A2B|nr:protein of unknown function DUF3102 [Cyanobacterium sp. HL-69]
MSNLSTEKFDYSGLDIATASLAKESAIEIKAREKAIWENIIEIGNKLIAVKKALPHGSFGKWVKSEFEWSQITAGKYIKVAQELSSNYKDSYNLPNSFEAIYQLASGFSKTDETTKEQILNEVKNKTQEKGKALTEKEIKEITAKIKSEYEARISILEGQLEQTEIESDSRLTQIVSLESSLRFKEEKYEAQNQTIKEMEDKKQVFFEKELELAQQKKELGDKQVEIDTLIDKKAKLLAQEEIDREKARLLGKEQELEEQIRKTKNELKEAKKLRGEAETDAYRLKKFVNWMGALETFTENINENSLELFRAINSLQSLPDLSILTQEDQKIVSPQIRILIEQYDEARINYGKATQKITQLLNQLNLNTFNDVIEAEVIMPKKR